MTDTELETLKADLREQVADIAHAAASWSFDGNTTEEHYRRILAGIDDGDPEVLDALAGVDWSGQWADGPQWEGLFAEYIGEDHGLSELEYAELEEELFVEIAQDYGDQVFFDQVATDAREHLAP